MPRLHQTFTATFAAFGKYGNGSKPQAAGTLYVMPPPPGHPHDWFARGVAYTSAAGDTVTRTVTFVDDTAVIQHYAGRNATHEGVLVYTGCPAAGTHPSLLNVAAALNTATAIDEAAMLTLVGDGACEGPDVQRYVVSVSGQAFVVCWSADPTHVVVSGREFFASE